MIAKRVMLSFRRRAASRWSRLGAQGTGLRQHALWRLSGILSADAGNDMIAEIIRNGTPASVGKLGAAELAALRYLARDGGRDRSPTDWGEIGSMLHVNAGVFPDDPDTYARFCGQYLQALKQVDLLGAWYQRGEWEIARGRAGIRKAAEQRAIEPYYHPQPWSRALEGKRVLVVSPFAASVSAQYARRLNIWPDREILPQLELQTLGVPFSAGIERPRYSDWFAALEAFREEMAGRSFDVAIVGAGAWSLPLTAHARSLGRIGIHMGGATQVLFGIRGARWDNHPVIARFYNEAWARPRPDERPAALEAVEGGCYW